MPYLRQRSLTGIPASASFKIATIWLSVMRLLIVKLLCFSLKEILRVGCIILRGSYTPFMAGVIPPNGESRMTPEEIAIRAIEVLNSKITNEIFTIIQNDRELMQAYLRAVETVGLNQVNQSIGKAVKVAYDLTNSDRENEPSCTLIQSHQKFQ